jgi:hypothetical protein
LCSLALTDVMAWRNENALFVDQPFKDRCHSVTD